jgi:hypothetical protein
VITALCEVHRKNTLDTAVNLVVQDWYKSYDVSSVAVKIEPSKF